MQTHRKNIALLRAVIETLEVRQLLSSPGTLDTSFGTSGKVSTSYSPESAGGIDVAVQSDGKYVVVGDVGHDFLISRYNANGTLDTSFGVTHSGKVTIHVGSSSANSFGTTVAIAPNGDIVAAGFAGGSEFNEILGIVRLLPSGAPDTNFGSNGQITYGGLGGTISTGIAVQTDGKILIEGDSSDLSMGCARFNVNGSLDKSFADNGRQIADFGENTFDGGIAIDYNGTSSTNPRYGAIVIVGQELPDAPDKFAIVRLKSNGSFDSTFDGDGKTSPTLPGFSDADAYAVAIESDGSLIVAGDGYAKGASKSSVVVADYAPNGALVKSFGSGGAAGASFFSERDIGLSVVIGYTGEIIVADSAPQKFALIAFTPSGVLDTSFGTGGKASTTFSDQGGVASIAVASNRQIIAVGGGTNVDLASFYDFAPHVSVTSLDPTAGPTTHKRVGKFLEPVFNPASMIVSRDLRLPFATEVYFTLGGTATPPSLINDKRGVENYTLDGMTISPTLAGKTVYSVNIPANQTFVIVTLSPENIPASNTTATFTINSNALYDQAPPTNSTITILGTGSPPPPPPTNLTDTADSYVQDGSDAADNFGTATKIEVKEGSTGVNRISYLKFDLSSLGTVNSVKLNLFGELNTSNPTSIVTQLFSVADTTWSETGITFNNKPALSSTVLGSISVGTTTPTMYTVDVTSYVKAQLAAGNKTVSFALKDPSGGTPFIGFNSKEAGSNAPTLTVT